MSGALCFEDEGAVGVAGRPCVRASLDEHWVGGTNGSAGPLRARQVHSGEWRGAFGRRRRWSSIPGRRTPTGQSGGGAMSMEEPIQVGPEGAVTLELLREALGELTPSGRSAPPPPT